MNGIDRILSVRVLADGLPVTPPRNPWRCRAVSGLALTLGYGFGTCFFPIHTLLSEDGFGLLTESGDLLTMEGS